MYDAKITPLILHIECRTCIYFSRSRGCHPLSDLFSEVLISTYGKCGHQYGPAGDGQFLVTVLTLVASLQPPLQHGQGLLFRIRRLLLYLLPDFCWHVQLPGDLWPVVLYLCSHSDGHLGTQQQLHMLWSGLAVCGTKRSLKHIPRYYRAIQACSCHTHTYRLLSPLGL